MSFRPNMTEEEIHAEDMHRGRKGAPLSPPSMKNPPFKAYKGIDAPESGGMEAEDPIEDDVDTEGLEAEEEEDEDMEASMKGLKSYVRKAMRIPEEGEDFGKPVPEKKPRKGESKFETKIRQWSEEVKDRPERFPGGQKQAVAIAAEEAGVSKKSMSAIRLDAFVADLAETKKALTSRSMYIPRPVVPYDPFSVHSNATKATTRGHSALRGPDGTAPLIGETFEKLAEDEEVRTRTQPDTYKSCNVHGISYKLGSRCHPCSVMKSMTCKSCGGDMVKAAAGSMKCASCGRS